MNSYRIIVYFQLNNIMRTCDLVWLQNFEKDIGNSMNGIPYIGKTDIPVINS